MAVVTSACPVHISSGAASSLQVSGHGRYEALQVEPNITKVVLHPAWASCCHQVGLLPVPKLPSKTKMGHCHSKLPFEGNRRAKKIRSPDPLLMEACCLPAALVKGRKRKLPTLIQPYYSFLRQRQSWNKRLEGNQERFQDLEMSG